MICLLRTSIHYQAFPSCKRHPKWGFLFFFFPISSIVHTANSSEGFFLLFLVFFNGLYNSCGNFSKCRHLVSFSHSPQISISAAHTAGSPQFSFSIPVAAPDLFIFSLCREGTLAALHSFFIQQNVEQMFSDSLLHTSLIVHTTEMLLKAAFGNSAFCI